MMNVGALLFQGKLPFIIELDGEINGIEFSVRGKGVGDASTGRVETKSICTTGELPMPWTSIISSISYGAMCFTKYPSDIKDFLKSTFPEGYIQERTITFENDGTFETRAELTYENGAIYNRVKLTGTGFKPDGNILGKKLVYEKQPSLVYVFTQGDKLRCEFALVEKIIGGGYQVSRTTQHNTAIGNGPVHLPEYHHSATKAVMSKDPKERADHMVLVETVKAVDCNTY